MQLLPYSKGRFMKDFSLSRISIASFKIKHNLSPKSNLIPRLLCFNSLSIYPLATLTFPPSPHTTIYTSSTLSLSSTQISNYSVTLSLTLSMDVFHSLSSLSCELRIITAKNIKFKPSRHIFVRCYLSAGNNKRVKLDSQEISAVSSTFIWNESFSLDCFGLTKDSMKMLMQGTVVFELRCRNTVPVFGRIGKSQLLGRAEVPWISVFESPNMEIEKWVMMVPKKGGLHEGHEKPPSIQIGMKIEAPVAAEEAARQRRKRNSELRKLDECGCSSGHAGCESWVDYEVFALAVALEAF